jgi:hypothetical protein
MHMKHRGTEDTEKRMLVEDLSKSVLNDSLLPHKVEKSTGAGPMPSEQPLRGIRKPELLLPLLRRYDRPYAVRQHVIQFKRADQVD